MEPHLDSPCSPRTVWAIYVENYALNCVFMCMRPEMAMEFGFTKWNRCRIVAVNSNLRVYCLCE